MKNNETDSSLEKLLRLWEFRAFMREVIAKANGRSLQGPSKYWSEFRQHLLEARHANFDDTRFALMDGIGEATLNDYIAAGLFAWNKHSRRIFRIDEDLALVLANTDFNTLDWKAITWPFPAYAIEWPAPERHLNTLICAYQAEGVTPFKIGLGVVAWDNRSDDMLMNASVRADVRKAVARRDQAAYEKLTKVWKEKKFHADDFWLSEQKISSSIRDMEAVLNGSQATSDDKIAWGGMAFRLIAGLSLYLQSLSSKERTTLVKTSKVNAGNVAKNITHEAEVCHVSSRYVLSADERIMFRNAMDGTPNTVLAAHFRRGHWRRPPGQGTDPDAPKIVHVRPTLVRPDRIGDNELPGGSIAHVR